MAKSSIQFQKGLSLTKFQSLYGTEGQCYQALFAMRWPKGFVCPQCGHDHYSLIRTRAVYECSQCKHHSTVTAGTIFHATKLPLTVWFLGMYLMTQNKNGVSVLEMRRQLGISCNTAWRMKHKIMHVMFERDRGRLLEGDIHLDDSYLGGERIGGKRGRGTRGKTPFIIAVEMHNDQPVYIRLNRVSRFSRHEIELWSQEYLTPGSTVTSDGLNCFAGVTTAGCEHCRVVTGSGKKAGKTPVFTWLNTILGNIKNSLRGSYHSFRPKHASRYLAEFQYRFNRRFDLGKMIPGLIYAAVHTSPKPKPALSLPESR